MITRNYMVRGGPISNHVVGSRRIVIIVIAARQITRARGATVHAKRRIIAVVVVRRDAFAGGIFINMTFVKIIPLEFRHLAIDAAQDRLRSLPPAAR